MCGRFTLRTPIKKVAELFDVGALDERAAREPARFNIAPTQTVAAIRAGASGRELAWLAWNFVPTWGRERAALATINARAETVATKPAFREAFRQRRCLVPADGFYEWQREGRVRQPYFIHFGDDRPFALAALWQRSPHGAATGQCTIITTAANAAMRSLHDRMPVILAREQIDTWLDPAIDEPDLLVPLLVPCGADDLVLLRVGRRVNSAQNEGPECIAPAPREQQQGRLFDEA